MKPSSLLVHLISCSFWEQLPAAGCSCLKTSRQSSRLCLKAGIWRRLQVGASSLHPLCIWATAVPTNFPCLSPLPLSALPVASECCRKCATVARGNQKFLTHFVLNVGALTGKGKIQSSVFSGSSPQPWLPCPSPKWKRNTFVLLLGTSAFPPAWRGFSYLVFLEMPSLETEIRRSAWFPTLPMRTWLQLVLMALAADVTWVSDISNYMNVCARKVLGSDEKEDMKAHESSSAFLVTTLFCPKLQFLQWMLPQTIRGLLKYKAHSLPP